MIKEGFVFVYKSEGWTSFDVVNKCKRIFETKRCGHTGTLDPLATGVLVVAVGRATRFIELIPSADKAYEASFILGWRTNTLDITGEVVGTSDVKCIRADVEAALSGFRGEIEQTPPMFSALKVGGKRLYELAREGREVEREPRKVAVYKLDLISYDEKTHEGDLTVECSAGTYVRTLIDDLGVSLGCGAVMTSLRRTSANGVNIERCLTIAELQSLKDDGRLDEAVTPPEELLAYPKIVVTEAQSRRFSNGGELDLLRIKRRLDDGFYCVLSPENAFLGIGAADNKRGVLLPKKVAGTISR